MFRLSDLARIILVELPAGSDRDIARLAALGDATEQDISFVGSSKHLSAFRKTRAGVVIASSKLAVTATDKLILQVPDAEAAVAALLQWMLPEPARPPVGAGDPANVSANATIDPTARIAATAVVGTGAVIGPRSVIHSGVVVYDNVTIGADCELFANVVLRERVSLGDRVVIHAGSVIGTDGFGYRWDGSKHAKIAHIGSVRIDDDVEIGSCSCVDRGKFGETRIGRGTKIDNHVQIGHNARIGSNVILCGQVGIAGSVELGDGVMLGAQSGVADNITVAAGTMAAGRTGIAFPVESRAILAGAPAMPHKQWLRQATLLLKIPDLVAEIRELRSEIETLKKR